MGEIFRSGLGSDRERVTKRLSIQAETRREQLALLMTSEGTMVSEEEYFEPHEEGEFSVVENRVEILAPGITIFRDVGLNFYKIVKGDTLSGIKEKLIKIPEFSYIKDLPSYKLQSFNIPENALPSDRWLPIPLLPEQRELSDTQFIDYCRDGLFEMKQDPVYGEKVTALMESGKVTENEVLAMMMALAKQESGGKPLGQMTFYRYEVPYKAFSFSIFHILMEKTKEGKDGPGLRARRRLKMTEGQLYHPKNAAKLFLAFLIEKAPEMKRDYMDYFPLDRSYEDYATLYNGGSWRNYNPNYATNIQRYYEQALDWLDDGGVPEESPNVAYEELKNSISEVNPFPDLKFVPVRPVSLVEVIQDANCANHYVVKLDSQLENFVPLVEDYLKETPGGMETSYRVDKIGMGKDEQGPYVVMVRQNGYSEKLYPNKG